MPTSSIRDTDSEIPVYWANILFAVGVAKAAVAGAGIALALLGAFDIASAAIAADWIDQVQDRYFGAYASLGGLIGAVWKVIAR